MPTLDRREAEDLLYAEARLLDELRYDEWLNLLTPDILYWIPCNGRGSDPAHEISIAYDDSPRLHGSRGAARHRHGATRKARPSQTRRLISNVQLEEADGRRGAGGLHLHPL